MNSSPAPKRKLDVRTLWQERRGLIISGAITVVVLAGVIIGITAFGPGASTQSPIPAPITQPPATSGQLLQQAQIAAASGDTTAAADLAKQALAADPNNAEAQKLVDSLQAAENTPTASGQTPPSTNPPTGGGTTPPPPASLKPGDPNPAADAGFSGNVSNLSLLLPKSFDSYSLGFPSKSGKDVVLSGTAASANDPATHVLWAVHAVGSQAAARSFIDKTTAQTYPSDKSTAVVDGAVVYFGTDGTRFATVSYTRGRYVFEVVVTGNGVAPKTLKSLAVKAAAAFKDAPPK